MRNIKTIEADIAKLQLELALEKDRQNKMESAVHILQDLGWVMKTGKWCPPVKKTECAGQSNIKDYSIQTGDFVKTHSGVVLYIRGSRPRVTHPYGVKTFECSRVLKIAQDGTKVTYSIEVHPELRLTKIDPKDYMGYLAK